MRQEQLQRSLNRLILVVGVLAAFTCAVVSAESGGFGDAAISGLFVLLLVLAAGGLAAGFAVRALAPHPGNR